MKKKVCRHELPKWWQLRDRGTLRKSRWHGVFWCDCCTSQFTEEGVVLRPLGTRSTLDQEYVCWLIGDTQQVLYRPSNPGKVVVT